MRRRIGLALVALGAALTQTGAQAQPERQTPYWASIDAGRAMMRTGPGRNYPATWLYVRSGLPIRIVETYPQWRKIEDPDGGTGWMLLNLLSATRTAIVRGSEPAPMHQSPDESSPMPYRAEPGVVGRISDCRDGWCRFDVRGRAGYVRTDRIWGVDEGERL